MRIFVTGGAGYIGSQTVLQLLRAGHDVHVFDNFSNGAPQALERVAELAQAQPSVSTGDMRDAPALQEKLREVQPDAVIHFAGLKAVETSIQSPVDYYAQNVSGSLNLLRAMDATGCTRIIFSSSATVYGEALYLPYDEAHPIQPASPYGRSKAFIEAIVQDWAHATPGSSAVILRYFNPVGADPSGWIGEDPKGAPDNLLPYIAQVAVGRRDRLRVFGNDFDTRDGTGERDYIHVEDLAQAHCAALDYALRTQGCELINVGSGRSVTVLEMVKSFEVASGQEIPIEILPRRAGDVGRMLATTQKAKELLGWQATRSLHDICSSAWSWQSQNPDGYGEA